MDDKVLDEKIMGILEMGTGVKALLFDEDSKHMLANLIPHSRFLENDFFLFEHIANRKRDKITNITCIAVLRPDNIKMLIEEVSDPFYEQYIVLFTNQIDPLMIEILATSDTRCVISEVHEMYLDFYRQDSFLYTLCGRGRESYTDVYRNRRVADGLFSFLMTMKRMPSIKVQAGDNELMELAEMLNARLSQVSMRPGGTLVMLDRSFDLYTPLLYEWRYQALLHEHTEYENGAVRLGGRSYSLESDTFFDSVRFKDVYGVAEEIKGLVKKAEVRKKRLSNHIFDDLEENTKLSHQVDTHFTLHGHIMRECLRLKELSELEMSILLDNSISRRSLDEYLLDKEIPSIRRSKLLVLYLMRNGMSVDRECRNYPDLCCSIEKFMRRHQRHMARQPYSYSFDSDLDVKLGYQPAIKKVLRHLVTGKLREKYLETLREGGDQSEFIIVYVRGGLTYGEYREVQQYCSTETKSSVYLLSDSMVSYKNLLN
jgi:vacuolar protein sorting-associated protein 45